MKGRVIVEKENVFEKVFKDIPFTKDYCEKELKELEVQGKAQDISMRKEYADKTFALVCIYMVCVFLLIFLACSPATFNMGDNVMMVLLGTTTINVIGLFAIVMKNLFPNK